MEYFDNNKLAGDVLTNTKFSDIFVLENIQSLQDLFSETNGVASLITHPDGIPIIKPSNFCRLCSEIIRKTEKGQASCMKSDAIIGVHNSAVPIVQPCLSGGLWDAGVSIFVGGKHLANWLIGQVRNDSVDIQNLIKYAEEIGADKEEFIKALDEVPVMSVERFRKVSKMFYAFVNELSEKAYKNLLLKVKIEEQEKVTILLRQSEEALKTTQMIAGLGHYVLDLFTGLCYSSEVLDSIMGIDENFIRSVDGWIEIIHQDHREMMRAHFQDDVLGALEKFDKKYKIIKQTDQTEIWEHGKGELILNSEGQPIKMIGTITDITARKQAEEALMESEEKLSTLFKSMTEMVVLHQLIFDSKGNSINYRIFECNEAFTEITGIKREDAIGKLATEVYKTETAPYLKEFSKIAITGTRFEYTTYFAPMDKHFAISVVSPKKNQFATVTTDITAIKQIEEVITAKNKELENYLYVASLDLRSPLVNIQGFSQRLRKQTESICRISEPKQISFPFN